jgi:mannose-6-phosphate isomerase
VERAPSLVGAGFRGSEFPLMVKLIDARHRLSVQVHPNEAVARARGRPARQDRVLGVSCGRRRDLPRHAPRRGTRRVSSARWRSTTWQDTLNRFEARQGDVFFLPARTVHALGEGCLLYEVQQTSDITFRVYDWDRLGSTESRDRCTWPNRWPPSISRALVLVPMRPRRGGPCRGPSAGCEERVLVDCPHFTLREQRVRGRSEQPTPDTCVVVTCVAGQGTLSTPAGQVALLPMQTVLVPADAGSWRVDVPSGSADLLIATPKF